MYQSGNDQGLLASPDTQASYPGLFLSAPLSVRFQAFSFVLAPEYRLTFAPVHYQGSPLPPNSVGSIAYLRGGLAFDLDGLTVGASGALRTARFAQGLAIDPPAQAGAELHWVLPDSSVALSGFVAGEITSPESFYLMSGLGIGVLF